MRGYVLTGLALAAGCLGLAQAQTQTVQVPADGIIGARQAAYALMGANAADMKRAIDAKVTDVKPFKADALAINKWASNVPNMFPVGTEHGHDTRALPAVWSDRPGFEKAAGNLATTSAELAKAADANDPAAFASAFQEMGKACGACHRNYRVKQPG